MIIISNKFLNFFRKNSSQRKYLSENKISHYLLTCDLMEYNFKDINKTFNISYFSKSNDLISEKFSDSKNLKDYESFEKSTDENIEILIKKFKLRISFIQSNKFSKEIIISDDYGFNPNLLPHSDSIIKIAIVKDNPEEWINNSNLTGYDYIFTLTENYKELIKNKTCFVINNGNVYENIKTILNILYKRKVDKFYLFLKNTGFSKVFPSEKDYFKVLDSEYFDEDWYREKYSLSDNTDSVIHFLLVGYIKGNDPSPNFSTHEYYECNKDVEIASLNPLVHYETHGRKENRIIHVSEMPKRNYSIIYNSPYFDEEWYKSTYGLDKNIDAVDHYLNVGFTKGYHPGPNFNNLGYYESNADVKETHMNPLLHYELYGRKENRALFIENRYEQFYSSILNSPYFDGEWYKFTYDIGDWDPIEHYLNIGFTLCFNPGPDFSTIDYYECNDDVKEYGMNPLAHYELYGRKEKRPFNITEMYQRDYSLILNSPFFDEDWYRSTYNIGEEDIVDHYLNIGFLKGFNPGPDFSTFEYFECNKDVKEWKMNPLIHYEFYGRKENRTLFSENRYEQFYSSVSNSPYFDNGWYKSTYDIADWDAAEHYLKIGFALGYNPGPDFNTRDYYEANPDVDEYGMNPLVHYEIYGRNENRKLKLDEN